MHTDFLLVRSAASGKLPFMYIGRLISVVDIGVSAFRLSVQVCRSRLTRKQAASMLTPLYTSENAPRAIRGDLTGLYQLFIATGTMMSFWINYGSQLHLTGKRKYVVPLACQMIPALYARHSNFDAF